MKRLRTILILLVTLAVIAALAFWGIRPRMQQRQQLRDDTVHASKPAVTVIHPTRGAPAEEVVLPGNIQAFRDAPIFARTDGYLKRWYFDIGARVKTGDLLAVIESPEIDQQLQQAKEDVTTAKANLNLAQITAARYTDLFRTDSVARQDVDNAVQTAAARAAAVKSAEANVGRLQNLVGFEQIYAPFDGVITARNTDVGQLISAGPAAGSGSTTPGVLTNTGTGAGTGRELFHISAVSTLRVFVQVPQTYSHDAVPGMKADLTLPELPGKRFTGTLVRTAKSMDPATRTLLSEIDVSNLAGLLFPGAYTEIHLKVHSNAYTLIIPSTSLIFRSQGLRVPIVKNGKVNLIQVTLGRDFGNTVEILAGLSAGDSIVANPPDSLVDGEDVRIVSPKAANEAEE